MSVIRKFSAIELPKVITFGDFCQTLLNVTVNVYGSASQQVYLVFENYQYNSPKSSERQRRSNKEDHGPCYNVLSENQPIPDMGKFWKLQENKINFQEFFVNYCVAHNLTTISSRRPTFRSWNLFSYFQWKRWDTR